MFRLKRVLPVLLIVLLTVIAFSLPGFTAEKDAQYIPDAAAAEEGMTMWQVIKAGGEVMIFLALLSVAALGLIVYYFMAMKLARLLPEDFMEKAVGLLGDNRHEEARQLCEENKNLISSVLLAGLSRAGRGRLIVKEAMQDEGRRGTDSLWQRLSYLADVAAIAPMVGLLGTVLGMIQAFNVIAFQAGAVKPILLASGISKAMVTTATGLIIAIPAMIFYSFFRGIVQDVAARLENISTELWHIMTEKSG